MPRRIDTKNFFQPIKYWPIATGLQALEVLVHVPSLPGRVSHELGYILPVGIVRVDHDHRIVGSATAQGARPWIKHAVMRRSELRILTLLLIVGVMTHKEVPLERLVLGRES